MLRSAMISWRKGPTLGVLLKEKIKKKEKKERELGFTRLGEPPPKTMQSLPVSPGGV